MAKHQHPNRRANNNSASKRRRQRRARKLQRQLHAFDRSDEPTNSSKKSRACAVASKVRFEEMTVQEKEEVSLRSRVNYQF